MAAERRREPGEQPQETGPGHSHDPNYFVTPLTDVSSRASKEEPLDSPSSQWALAAAILKEIIFHPFETSIIERDKIGHVRVERRPGVFYRALSGDAEVIPDTTVPEGH